MPEKYLHSGFTLDFYFILPIKDDKSSYSRWWNFENGRSFNQISSLLIYHVERISAKKKSKSNKQAKSTQSPAYALVMREQKVDNMSKS